jgi:hypothetical protein
LRADIISAKAPALGTSKTLIGTILMPKIEEIESLEAKQGEKMIEVKLRFWTNKIAPEDGKVLPKHAWTGGVARIERNKSHGIEPGAPLPFHSLLDIGSAVEKVLISHGIVLHASPKMRKYVKDKD